MMNVEDITMMAPLKRCFRFEIKEGFDFSLLIRSSLDLFQAIISARNSAEFQLHCLFLPTFVTQI